MKTSLSDLMRRRRLERARRLLADPGQTSRSIAEIAYGLGLGDLSNFNRAFRRHFGCTPSDLRPR